MNIEQEKLEMLMHRYNIAIGEVDGVIDFVSDLLDAYADDIEKAEPYATNTIQKLRSAAYETWNLHEYLQVSL